VSTCDTFYYAEVNHSLEPSHYLNRPPTPTEPGLESPKPYLFNKSPNEFESRRLDRELRTVVEESHRVDSEDVDSESDS
jgi:hypothetical protein